MAPDVILFFILAAISIAAAIGMIISRNAVYSALMLIVNFAMVAIFYLMLGAPFIALSQVTVYAGAIMVLFLFVIMLLGAERLVPGQRIPWQIPLAVILGVSLLIEAAYFMFANFSNSPLAGTPDSTFGGPLQIGTLLFTEYLLPFEVTSVLLLVAMIGAIVLTRKKAV